MGFSDSATSLAAETVKRTEASGHPIPICVALIWAASTYFGTGDWEKVEQSVRKFIDYAERYSLDSYCAVGYGATGKLLVRRGDAAEGVKMLETALATLHARRYELHTAAFNIALAEGWARIGQADRAIAILDVTMSSIERGGNRFRMPELLRLKGVLLCSFPQGDAKLGETLLLQSLRLARQQGALAWELRAASSIARIWLDTGRGLKARNLLASVYDRFTEGFHCHDLREARELLNTIERPSAATMGSR
jgi:tetratricopeptide (TPR) repeat protein